MTILLKALAAVPIALMAAAPVNATTVTLDLNEGSGTHSNLNFDGYGGSGTWSETGFSVDWIANELYDPSALSPSTVTSFNDAVFLSDSAGIPFPTMQGFTVSRPDGLSFNLKQFEVSDLSSSWYGEAVFTPYALDGSLDYGNEVREYLDIAYYNILLSGTTDAGTAVRARANAFTETTSLEVATPLIDGVITLPSGQFEDLIDISFSLRFETDLAVLMQPSLEYSGASTLLKNGFFDCLSSNSGGSGCALAGQGEFSFAAFPYYGPNWGTALAIDNLQLQVNAPASVPVPAGWLLGLTGLGALTALRRRAKV